MTAKLRTTSGYAIASRIGLAIGASVLGSLTIIGCGQPSKAGSTSQEPGSVRPEDKAVRDLKGLVAAYLSECETMANMFGGSGSQSAIVSQKGACELTLSRITGLQTDARLWRVKLESDMISLRISSAISSHEFGVEYRRVAARGARSVDEIHRQSEESAKKENHEMAEVASDIRKRVGAIRQCMDGL